ncbi:MAG: SCP2 sterol-binding domain-containing protein [Gammaproteobacteria bacterium]|nr:SCP2 sterol-binding domain-containing protein [Gammaproteobacteria bacterium]MDE2272807.1 SCP2 sterol-binding domain-containing protein [Gammaproteobacteria bacterium]
MSAPALAALLAPAVELALRQALAGSSAAVRDLKQLDGKVIALELKELPFKLYFLPQAEQLAVRAEHEGRIDLTVRAPSFALLEAALKRGDTPPRGIELNGDAETGQIFSRLLKQADLDWEELLSRYVGDVAAHQIGNLARGLLRWGRDAGARLAQDLAEYLQYESGALPPRHEVEDFLDSVDRLRNDAERLAARVQRLAGQHRKS